MFMTITILLLLYDYDHSSMHSSLPEFSYTMTCSEPKRRDQIAAGWDLQSPRRCISPDLLTDLTPTTTATKARPDILKNQELIDNHIPPKKYTTYTRNKEATAKTRCNRTPRCQSQQQCPQTQITG